MRKGVEEDVMSRKLFRKEKKQKAKQGKNDYTT
jgi:hypothetical protein